MLTLMRLERFTGLHCLDRVAEKLAYKACRSAIMIGDALNRSQMTQVVRNLANLARPWVKPRWRVSEMRIDSFLL